MIISSRTRVSKSCQECGRAESPEGLTPYSVPVNSVQERRIEVAGRTLVFDACATCLRSLGYALLLEADPK